MKNIFLFVLSAIMLFSCGKSGRKAIMFSNDFEKVIGTSYDPDNAKFWGSPVSLVKGVAHSGEYASKMDSSNTYSFGFKSIIKNIKKDAPIKIKVKLWVYAGQPNPDATLVVDINNNGKSKYWKNAALSGVSKGREWTECSASFDIPTNINVNDEVKIFVWNPNMQLLYIDDFEISFE
jgi:hypothetical protein